MTVNTQSPVTFSFSERRDWLRLTRTPTVGPVAFRDLLIRYKTAGAALEALPDLVRKKAINIPSLDSIEQEMALSESFGARILCSAETDYPKHLRALNPPPPILTVRGFSNLIHQPCIAVIGSRNASAIGQRFARQISSNLGEAGFVIVSGLARGIDTVAHKAALGTGTVGVLGGGIDHIYPKQNEDLYQAMSERGTLVSESPFGFRATAHDFPRRNRIISGLCAGVVVIEAAERSGTLITARYALEQNREVMAAPGSPLDPRAKGCNRLIRQGAALIESADDIIEVLQSSIQTTLFEPPDFFKAKEFNWAQAEEKIQTAKPLLLNLISPTPTSRDEIIRASELSYPVASAALLELELNGAIWVEPNGYIAALGQH